MEENEDRILLSSLGVTSANPEDIERDILAAVFTWFLYLLYFAYHLHAVVDLVPSELFIY